MRHFAGAERGSRVSQFVLNPFCERKDYFKRVNFLGRKIVADEPDERKEDSDDESEEDEARHPLIVHDRDPEQNLEALRNPDAYRQNLA